MKWWWNLWWNLWCNCSEYCFKMYSSVRFLWRASTRGDFPIQSGTWQVEITSGSTGSSRTPQYTHIQSMRNLSMCPSSNYGGVQVARDTGCSLNCSLHPESQLEKNSANLWWNYDETYDVIALNTASKCLARMKGCWDPEFEPSVEEIMDYRWDIMAILLIRFLWWARTQGDLPIQSSIWHVHVEVTSGSPAQAARPNIRVYRECAVCRCVLVRIMAAYSSTM